MLLCFFWGRLACRRSCLLASSSLNIIGIAELVVGGSKVVVSGWKVCWSSENIRNRPALPNKSSKADCFSASLGPTRPHSMSVKHQEHWIRITNCLPTDGRISVNCSIIWSCTRFVCFGCRRCPVSGWIEPFSSH